MKSKDPDQISPEPSVSESQKGTLVAAADRFRNQLIEPLRPAQDQAERRRLRLLASLLLALIVMDIVSTPFIVKMATPDIHWAGNPLFYLSVTSLLFFIVGYFMVRRGYFMFVAVATTILTWFVSVSGFLVSPSIPNVYLTIVYLTAVVLLASMLFSWRSALLVAAIAVLTSLLLPAASPDLSVADVMPPLTGLITTSALLFALLRHNRKLEFERRQQMLAAYQALQHTESRWRSLVNNAPTGIFMIGEDHRIELVNDRAIEITGYSIEDLVGTDFRTFLDGTALEQAEEYFQRRMSGQTAPLKYEFEARNKAGEKRWVEVTAAVMSDVDGASTSIIQLLDITNRKVAERALRQSEENYRLLVENQLDLVVKFGIDGRIHFVSPSYCEKFGKTEEELLGSHFSPTVHPDDREGTAEAMHSLHQPPYACHVEHRAHTINGYRWLAWANKAILNDEGGVEAIVAVGRDITQRKRDESDLENYRRQLEELVAVRTAEMRATESRYHSLFDRMQEAFIVADEMGNLVEMNQAAVQLLGCADPGDLYGKDSAILFATAEEAESLYQELVKTNSVRNLELRLKKQDGTESFVPVLISAIMRRDVDGEMRRIEAVAMDITQRKEAEEALRQQDEMLRSILEAIADGIVVLDSDFRYTYWNLAMEKLTGTPRSEVLQQRPAWEHFPHLQDNGVADLMQRTMEGEAFHQVTVPFQRPDGSTGFTSDTLLPLREADGEIDGIVRVIRDITERKRQDDEWRAVNQRLMELDRLRSKFISDVSHELRTPITSLRLYIDLLTRGAPEKRERYVSVIKEQGDRLRNLLDGILDFSSLDSVRGDLVFSSVDLRALVEQLVRDYGPNARTKGLNLTFRSVDDLPPIHGDEAQLAQMVNNLLVNAISYTLSGGIYVALSTSTAGDQVCLQVEDTGIGMDEEDLEYCFNPFYRGRRVGQYNLASGPGMGLAVVNEIVQLHGGRIEISSKVEEGSQFSIWLPVESDAV